MRVIARECQREAHESAAPPSNCGECGNDYWLHATVFRLPPAVRLLGDPVRATDDGGLILRGRIRLLRCLEYPREPAG